jgi:hypothetical protein
MAKTFHRALEHLGPGELRKIHDGGGQTLAVFDGLVWVTQAGDPRDAFVASGGAFTFDRPGLAVIEAVTDARLAVLAPIAEETEHHERAPA